MHDCLREDPRFHDLHSKGLRMWAIGRREGVSRTKVQKVRFSSASRNSRLLKFSCGAAIVVKVLHISIPHKLHQ